MGASTFVAWPERGARLMNWNLRLADETIRDVIHWPDLSGIGAFANIHGGNPILFPFCGRTYYKGDLGFWNHHNVRRPMPIHGFCRDGSFDLIVIDRGGFTARLRPTDIDHEAYPFEYEFSIKYRFEELSFQVELSLLNKDTVSIPWCAGHHFYFHLPWHPDATRADYRIEIPAKRSFYHGSDGHLERLKDFSEVSSLDESSLVDRIHSRLKRNPVVFGPKSGEEDIGIYTGPDPVPSKDYTIVTWSESPDSTFYCVEPWMGPPNSPEHKIGLRTVKPGETDSFVVEVSLL